MKYYISLLIVGLSLFSMFFGGGNLVFPLKIGIHTTSPILSILGFLLSSVCLPFYGVLIGVFFKGNYQESVSPWGKPIGHVLIFALLLMWIPLGSGPRCNQLAYGAFCDLYDGIPLWLYSLLYSIPVFVLTLQRKRFLDVLGKVVTPLLTFFLFLLIFMIFKQPLDRSITGDLAFSNFTNSLVQGYNTMDFIAAIFFSSSIITLLQEKEKGQFQFKFVRRACLMAVSLLTVVYLGMFTIGYLKSDILASISGDKLLAIVGNLMLAGNFKLVIFMIITLSVLSTSMALSLVFADYLNKTIFKERVGYKTCLLISVFISFFMSMFGFEKLSVFISYAMSILYPCLGLTVTVAFFKKRFQRDVQTT